ncbi:hypothetical protein HBH53_050820 [Parastagonospora nodorum]|nr:hypothetical protein HBH53_050820 [Parastagonospora nodorum]KAH4107253.1 hypothetical protein HBH46_062210 [Parastagonospora nodorum]KAH5117887.1 hypothetical protein HBH71_103370 [Parastagonospora nodorum]KAH5518804.1 hypothetical protein HBI52_086950 [Parastagonospora nodorum]KAH6043762.1 hypothetical protein HBI54_113050 [Parastagonospora nodorum]
MLHSLRAPRSENAYQLSSINTSSTVPKDDYLHQPKALPALARHSTSLIEHADQLQIEQTSKIKDGLASRSSHHESRRDGFTWGLKPATDDLSDQYRHSRNPLLPAKVREKTPPSLEELMRPPQNEDADAAHNKRVSRANTGDTFRNIRNPGIPSARSEAVTRHGTRKLSVAFFAKGLFPLASSSEDYQERRVSASSMESNDDRRTKHKLSFALPSTVEQSSPSESLTRDSNAERSMTQRPKELSKKSSMKSSLRDRRNVNFDLSLPIEPPDLPPRSRSPLTKSSSITPARPRSPKTPWIRDEPLQWRQAASQNTAPIFEEDYVGQATVEEGTPGSGLLPDNDPISSSHSPTFERPPVKVRDRCYVTRPRFNRSRDSRGERSSDALAHTPDGSWAPNDEREYQEQKNQTAVELEQLSQATKEVRSKRWRWARSATRSSDGSHSSPIAEPTRDRKFSVNPFRRSNRLAEQTDQDQDSKHRQSPHANRLWWIGKQSPPPPEPEVTKIKPPSHIAMPSAFTPPGMHHIPTPPTLDANGDIKGKLADFFFDHGTDIDRRPKARPSPGGYWDSDALLMSFKSPSIQPSDSTEEGPEGPVPEYAPRSFTCDANDYGTPGLVVRPGGYMNAGIPRLPRPANTEETWFRRCIVEQTQLTAAALRKIDERKKFEWIVPEHLPGSPLCPLHKNYQGYSIGVCYWHGRRRRMSGSNGSEGSDEFVGGVYELGKKEQRKRRRARAAAERRGDVEVKRGARGWQVGMFDQSPEEHKPKRNRLQSLSNS